MSDNKQGSATGPECTIGSAAARTDDGALLERIANIIDPDIMRAETPHGINCPGCEGLRSSQELCRDRARAILEAISTPTDKMLDAGSDLVAALDGVYQE